MRKRSQASAPQARAPQAREKTRAEKAYLQGWRAGNKGQATKDGPANHRVEEVRLAYLEGHEHGWNDLDLAEAHAEQKYG